MKKCVRRAYLLTLAVLQLFCAVGLCKVDAVAFEEIILEEATEELSDEAFEEPLSEDPVQDEITIEDEEYCEEIIPEPESPEEPEQSEDIDDAEDDELTEDDGDISVLEEIENGIHELSLDEAMAIVEAGAGNVYTGSCGKNLTYELDEDGKTLKISGTGKMDSFSNTDLAPWSKESNIIYKIENIIIEEGVTSIGSYAFTEMSKIKKISLPKTITKIEKYAFVGCTSLMVVSLNGKLPTVGTGAFEDSDVVVFYPSGVKGYGKKNTNKIKKQFRSVAFKKVDQNDDDTCGDNIKWSFDEKTGTLKLKGKGPMRDYSFVEKTPWYGYSLDITKVEMDDAITTIGDYAFYNMTIDSFKFPASVSSIGSAAFRYTKITSLAGAEKLGNVTHIGSYAFDNAAVDLVASDGIFHLEKVTDLGESAFSCLKMSKYGTLKLGNKLSVIPAYAFYLNNYLHGELVIPGSVREIGDFAFYYCNNLSGNLKLSDNVKDVGRCAFLMTCINHVDTGNGLKQVRYGAFGATDNMYYSVDLVTIKLGKSIESIEYHGIWSGDMEEVYFYGDRPSVEYYSLNVHNNDKKKIKFFYPATNPTWKGITGDYFGYASSYSLEPMGESYTVSFNITYPDGTEKRQKTDIAKQTVHSGCCAHIPALNYNNFNVNTKAYSFGGWYTDKKYTKPYDFKKPVTENITLYGKFEIVKNFYDYWGTISEADRQYMNFNLPEDVPQGFWVSDRILQNLVYSGGPITIRSYELGVYYHTRRLSLDKDFTVSYSNNVNAGKGTMTLNFIGNYSGKKTINLDIKPRDFSGVDKGSFQVRTDEDILSYNGKVKKPKVKVYIPRSYDEDFVLKEGTDYVVEYPGTNPDDKKTYDANAFKAPGTYKVIIKGKGNFTGTRYCNIEIVEKTDLSTAQCKMPSSVKTTDIKNFSIPDIKVNGRKLRKSVDYEDSYNYDLASGVITVTYIACDASEYSGQLVKKIKIKGKKTSSVVPYVLDEELFLFANKSDLKKFKAYVKKYKKGTYTGREKLPDTVENYFSRSVYYDNGKCYVRLSPRNIYGQIYVGEHTISVAFSTVKDITVKFNKKVKFDGSSVDVTGAFSILLKGKDITSETDYYKVTTSFDKDTYKAFITVSPSSDNNGFVLFRGDPVTFEIPRENIEGYDLSKSYSSYVMYYGTGDTSKSVLVRLSYTGYADKYKGYPYRDRDIKPEIDISIKDPKDDNYSYIKPEYYDVAYKNCKAVGTATLTITGKAPFTGTININYSIVKNNVYGMYVDVKDAPYKDEADNYKTTFTIRPYADGNPLKAGVDYDPNGILYYYYDAATVKRYNKKSKKYVSTKVKAGSEVTPGDIAPIGTRLTIYIPLIGNYGTYIDDEYYVVNKDLDLSKATVKLKKQFIYDGTDVDVAKEDLEVTLNGKVLSSDDYSLIFPSPRYFSAGDKTVYIWGNGSKGYTGMKTFNYKVLPQKIS